MPIYLDYAATTPLDPRVLKAMAPYFTKMFANAMSQHQSGQAAKQAVDTARQQVADFLACSSSEVYFTSGATESNNLALKGLIYALDSKEKPHLIISSIEHHCVLETAAWLEKQNLAEVTHLPINAEGIVDLAQLQKSLKKNTVLVSVMYVNNEIGTIQPIKEISCLVKKYNPKIILHTDAVQAINYLNCRVNELGVDLLSFSGHKIYGPKGVGVLYKRKGVKLAKIQQGGEQEFGLRAGTHNVPGIVGLGAAIKIVQAEGAKNAKKIQALRDLLWQGINKNISDVVLNGSLVQRVPNNLNVSFKKVEGEGVLISLDLESIEVSTGSACASGSLDPSHVILALSHGDHLRAHASVRFSLGKHTTKAEISTVIKKLPALIARLRKISPFK